MIWSTVGVGLKLAVSQIDSFIVTVYIELFATLSLFAYIIYKKKIKRTIDLFKKNGLYFLITGIIGFGLHQVLYLKGYQLLPATDVVIIMYLYPLFMVLISSIFFKEKISTASFFFVLLGFFGVYVMISKGTWTIPNLNLGTSLVLVASFCWALFSILLKNKKVDVEIGIFLAHLFGFLFLITLIPFFGFTFDIVPVELLGIAYLALFPFVIGVILWNMALHRLKTSICSNIALSVPFTSIVLIFLILKESIHISQLAGLIIIVTAIYLDINFGDKKK